MDVFKSMPKVDVVSANRQRDVMQVFGSEFNLFSTVKDLENYIFANSREQRLSIKSELQIRKKAMIDDNFPSQEIIDEFFQAPIEMDQLKLDWNQPNVVKFLV